MTRFSNGSAKVFCALGEGAARTMPADRTDSEGFLRFLEAVRRSCGKFVMILDNTSYHDSGPVREGVEKMEGAGLIFLPPVPLRRFAAFDPGRPLACRQAPPRVRGSRLGILSTVIGCTALAPMPPLAAPPHAARACPSVLAPRPPLDCAA